MRLGHARVYPFCMRPLPARILFCLLAVAAVVLGTLTRQVVFFVVAAMATVMLASSLSTSRLPLTRALRGFEGRAVDVLLWGAPPLDAHGPYLVLESVNVISVGVHLFFKEGSGPLLHLKIAQPRGPSLTPERVSIATAKYVQWNATRLKAVVGAPAVSITLRAVP